MKLGINVGLYTYNSYPSPQYIFDGDDDGNENVQ